MRKKTDLPYLIIEIIKDKGTLTAKEIWAVVVSGQHNIDSRHDTVLFDFDYFMSSLKCLSADNFVTMSPMTDRYTLVKELPPRKAQPVTQSAPVPEKPMPKRPQAKPIETPPDHVSLRPVSEELTGELVVSEDSIEAKPSLGFGAEVDEIRGLVTLWQKEEDRRKRCNQIVLTKHHMGQLADWWNNRAPI